MKQCIQTDRSIWDWQMAGQFAGLYWINVMLLAGMQIPLQLFGHAFEP